MARLANISDIFPMLIRELGKDVPDQIKLLAAKDSIRALCERHDLWTEELMPMVAEDYKEFYLLDHPYDAQIHKILWLTVNGVVQDVSQYDLWDEIWVRFLGMYPPHDLDYQVLQCGPAGIATLAAWKVITNGSLTVTLDTTSMVSGISFASCTSMDDVGWRIQTAIRALRQDNTLFVRWVEDTPTTGHFVFWGESGTIGYLAAGTIGTDVSGQGFLNGLSGGTGVLLGGRIYAKVVFRPDVNSDTLPFWFLDRWATAIVWLTVQQLCEEPGKDWTDPGKAKIAEREYKRMLVKHLDERTRGYKYASNSIGSRELTCSLCICFRPDCGTQGLYPGMRRSNPNHRHDLHSGFDSRCVPALFSGRDRKESDRCQFRPVLLQRL